MNSDSSRRSPATEYDGVDGDPVVWAAVDESLREVQSMLDRNRRLIEEVNENQQTRLRHNMVKNVSLIQELNGNISKVLSLYSDLNSTFSAAFQNHHSAANVTPDKS
ncbi:protein EARLY FLOWERING 4 [Vigna radiata var. radiata]|uniref:Protein EARLY FLOWERING 4 n=1 Tax=Vigna radiata var. radiata TaxID=3916 RepID=A0A1S3UED1_VIGRR|nr:protein EARLY FLOWERING 4 [Vigna radiata var. radiata]